MQVKLGKHILNQPFGGVFVLAHREVTVIQHIVAPTRLGAHRVGGIEARHQGDILIEFAEMLDVLLGDGKNASGLLQNRLITP